MLKLFKNLNKKNWMYICIIFILVVVQVWLDLKMPDYMANITKLVQTEGSEFKDILSNGLMMLACCLGSLLSAILTGLVTSSLAADFSMSIRRKLFYKVEDLSIAEVKKFQSSSLITRTTNDITQIQMFTAMGLQLLLKAPLTAVLAILKILNKSWEWSALTAVGVVILMSVVGFLIVVVTPRFKLIQKLIDKLNSVTRENLIGIRVVRAYNAERYQENKFDEVNNKLTNEQLFSQRMFAIMQPAMYMVMYLLPLGIYYIGANLINKADMMGKVQLFGDMIVFSSYAMQVIISFLMLAIIFMVLPRASVSASRINEVLSSKSSIVPGSEENGKTKEAGTIEFKNVSFKYPDGDEELLKNINFKVNRGETLAIIGSTGSGKSTLVNLIPRLYDATEGTVLVDGVDVKAYNESALNNKIGFVTQKAILFNGTVSSNVLFGDNGKTKEKNIVKKAIEVAQAEEFVLEMDNKYDSFIASGGTNISGGQKQRLSIARAIAKKPNIYIFDDSFSALDYKTDSNLRKALKEYTNNATTIIVAQRIGTIMNADKILVLDEGKIVGSGTHNELLNTCDVYKQIALSQLSEEELYHA